MTWLQVVVASHSWGDNVFRNFLVWVTEDDPKWVDKHIHAYVNIAGPVLGVAKSMTSLLSGDTAAMACLLVSDLVSCLNVYMSCLDISVRPEVSTQLIHFAICSRGVRLTLKLGGPCPFQSQGSHRSLLTVFRAARVMLPTEETGHFNGSADAPQGKRGIQQSWASLGRFCQTAWCRGM